MTQLPSRTTYGTVRNILNAEIERLWNAFDAVADLSPETLEILGDFDANVDIADSVTGGNVSTPGTDTNKAVADLAGVDEVDFVDLVTGLRPSYTTAKLTRTGSVQGEIRLTGEDSGVIYNLRKDTNDDFIKIYSCSALTRGYGLVDTFIPETSDLTGTWNTATASWYTTSVGATFTMSVSGGSELRLRILRESRGGLWNISVDGGAPIPVSCYAASQGATIVTLATGLDDEPHTVVGTFAGDDPDNAPSSSPSRGYLRIDVDGVLLAYGESVSATQVLDNSSNKEMAFQVQGGNWVPDHGTGTAWKVDEPTYYVDGEPVNFAGSPNGTEWPVAESVALVQHFTGDPFGTGDVMEFRTVHKVTLDGVLRFDGSMIALENITSMTGYPLMLPAETGVMDTFVTSTLSVQANSGDNQEHPFAADRNNVSSGAVVSSTNRDLIVGATLINPKLSLRRGKTGTGTDGTQTFVWHRTSAPKMYFRAFSGSPMGAGDAYLWGFRLVIGSIPGVYAALTS